MGRKKTEHTKKPAKDALQTIQEAQEQSQTIRPGIDLGDDTASSGISGDIVEVNAEGGLNLRIGPGRSYPVTELLEYGTLLTVLELPHGAAVPGWALVHTGERTGWVDRLFIREPEENKEE